ncbi:glutamate decarboxylase, partial [Shigella dysenteriae]
SKARIIHQIQLIRGITKNRSFLLIDRKIDCQSV